MFDLTLEKMHLFLLVIFPGILAIKVYDLFYPPQKRDFGSSLLEAATYGVINLGIFSWPLVAMNEDEFARKHTLLYVAGSFLFLVVSPVALALFAVWARQKELVTSRIGWPSRSAWDDFFKRGDECWILVHLKSGKMLGVYYGKDSYSTSYPDEPEFYAQEVWRVDENGRFVEKIDGSLGTIIKQSECERLEFLKVEAEVR